MSYTKDMRRDRIKKTITYVSLLFLLMLLVACGQQEETTDDGVTYLGNQLECEFGENRCFGIVCNMDFILIATYEENGENPELVIYKKR